MRITTALVLVSGLLAGGLVAVEPASAATKTFGYTGSYQTYQVPAGVTSVIVDAWGAQGGPYDISQCGSGGFGGHTRSVLEVTPKETLRVYVGGAGGIYAGSVASSFAGGFNGGGQGHIDTVAGSRGGGGASDVRRAPYALADRLVVAGGGGGAGNFADLTSGGAGGGSSGAAGMPAANGGGGGTQTKGGAAGTTDTPVQDDATAGTRGQGGNGGYASGTGAFTGGGGGGGWFGGGGAGGAAASPGAGGGGGSSHGPAGSLLEQGVRGVTGACDDVLDGKVVIRPTPSDGTYTALTPKRILDTRSGLGAKKGRVGKGRTVALEVTGRGGVASSGVAAAVLDVTVIAPAAAGFLTAWPCGRARPASYSLSFGKNETVTTLVTSRVSSAGSVCLYLSAAAHLVADVQGSFAILGRDTASRFTAVPPAQLVNTGQGSVVAAGKVLRLGVLGQHGVPTSGVTSVVLNLLAPSPRARGSVTAYPCSSKPPHASSLSFIKGRSRASLAIVKLGAQSRVCVVATVATPMIVDVTGWNGRAGATAGARLTPVTAHRVLDTRSGLGATNQPIGATSVAITAVGKAGLPKTGVTAVVLDVTALRSARSGRLTVYTCGRKAPRDGTLFTDPSHAATNEVVVSLNSAGQFCLTSTARTDATAEILGWYGPSGA